MKVTCAAFWVVLLIWLLHTDVWGGNESSERVFMLSEIWKIECAEESPYSTIDPWIECIPTEIMGVTCDHAGSIFVCDRITNQLVKIGPGGNVAFSVGQAGSGPEDHYGEWEPHTWNNGFVYCSDYSSDSKIIVYSDEGEYVDTVFLDGLHSLSKAWLRDGGGVGLTTIIHGNPGVGVKIESHVVRFNETGATEEDRLVKEVVLPPAGPEYEPREEEFWYFPRIAVSGSGYIFVQEDLYSGHIECWNWDFEKLWEVDGGWRPVKRSKERIAEIQEEIGPRLRVAENDFSIKRMIARNDGSLWIEPASQVEDLIDGEVLFQEYDADGKYVGTVRLRGMQSDQGHIQVFDNMVLWIDEHCETGAGIYSIVYQMDELDGVGGSH